MVYERAQALLMGHFRGCVHGDLWSHIATLFTRLRQRYPLHVHKVKAHVTSDSEQDPTHTEGNTHGEGHTLGL